MGGYGHGVGIDDESPVISQFEDATITNGMAFALHPLLTNADRTLSTTVANTYVMKDGRSQALSNYPHHVWTL